MEDMPRKNANRRTIKTHARIKKNKHKYLEITTNCGLVCSSIREGFTKF